jgi:hypothetical protein
VNPGRGKTPMPESVAALLRESYRDEILRFEERIGRDLGAWLREPPVLPARSQPSSLPR